MTCRITELDPAAFAPLFAMDAAALADIIIHRVIAGADHGWPCRVSLEDAQAGESDAVLRRILADPAIAYIHAHNAAPGCFSARIDRA